jgi:hypothetical protein
LFFFLHQVKPATIQGVRGAARQSRSSPVASSITILTSKQLSQQSFFLHIRLDAAQPALTSGIDIILVFILSVLVLIYNERVRERVLTSARAQ